MQKTIVELFAGVGGFRVGFENQSKKWQTVWASQWEPSKKVQHAYDCYKHHFFKNGGVDEYTNKDIAKVQSVNIPNHTLLVGGFPCQDYSVAGVKAKGIEGKKGVLWWEIRRIIEDKRPPFILLENVDRLLKSPSNQRGRDFAVMLSCLNNLGYGVEWRVINAADYGFQQRRRRVFIFCFHKSTKYYKELSRFNLKSVSESKGMFAQNFPIFNSDLCEKKSLSTISSDIKFVSDNHNKRFENTGIMMSGEYYDFKSIPCQDGNQQRTITLESLLERGADSRFFLTDELYEKFKYMKGAKKKARVSSGGYAYNYSEGAVPFPDILNRPARTILTSESANNRSTHIVKDCQTGKLRKITPIEAERINGFPDNWTDTGMPERFRYFCMGNALVVNLITKIAQGIEKITDQE